MPVQVPPAKIRNLLGDSYKWLINFLHQVNNTQTATNSSLFVAGLTIQNNTPSGGKLTWGSCTVFYQGVAYSIAAGSTPNSELFVVWTVGQNVFTPVNSFSPGLNTFPIITNSQGTGDITWDKVGANSVQAAHLFPVLTYDGPNGSLIISNVMFSDNTPGAGSVAWSACQATYQGITYSIAAGNAPGLEAIIWKLASPTVFQAVGFPPLLGADDFLLGQNIQSSSPVVTGFFARSLRNGDRTGAYTVLDETGLQGVNKNSNPTFRSVRAAADGTLGAAGQVAVFDGTSANNNMQAALFGNPGNPTAVGGMVFSRPCVFAQLPTTNLVAGCSAKITDGAAYSFGAIAAGGGTIFQPVFWDGINWRQG